MEKRKMTAGFVGFVGFVLYLRASLMVFNVPWQKFRQEASIN